MYEYEYDAPWSFLRIFLKEVAARDELQYVSSSLKDNSYWGHYCWVCSIDSDIVVLYRSYTTVVATCMMTGKYVHLERSVTTMAGWRLTTAPPLTIGAMGALLLLRSSLRPNDPTVNAAVSAQSADAVRVPSDNTWLSMVDTTCGTVLVLAAAAAACLLPSATDDGCDDVAMSRRLDAVDRQFEQMEMELRVLTRNGWS